jgi:hypothetical protein
MHAAVGETVVPAVCRGDMAPARASDVQLRIAWTGWLSRAVAGAEQRQCVPAD